MIGDVEYLYNSGNSTTKLNGPPIFEEVNDEEIYVREGEWSRRVQNGDKLSIIWPDVQCKATTRFGERCQGRSRHAGKHTYTSKADGRSFTWEEVGR